MFEIIHEKNGRYCILSSFLSLGLLPVIKTTIMYEFGIIGGTGSFGSGVALRLAQLGKSVIIGSRSNEKGSAVAKELSTKVSGSIAGGSYKSAAQAKIIVVTIPPDQTERHLLALQETIDSKIVLDCTVSLQFGKTVKHKAIDGKSSYQNVCKLLPNARVVATFKTISANEMQSLRPFDEANFVIGQNDVALQTVEQLSNELGLTTYTLTQPTHALTVERMTALAIQLSKKYKAAMVGYKVTGIDKSKK